jgi:hypothetical protein
MPKKKWLREFTLNVASGRHHQHGYRESPSLLIPSARRVEAFKRGVPLFSRTVDTIQNFATGNRQYKPPMKKVQVLADYDETSYHNMSGKFQFHIDGRFPNSGTEFEREMFGVASDLFLVGFMKVRAGYALGHLQGDVLALSYMRKWMEYRYNESGTIDNLHFFGDSYGIPEFRYSKLECIKDWRSPVRRRQHMGVLHEEARITKLEERSRKKRAQRVAVS